MQAATPAADVFPVLASRNPDLTEFPGPWDATDYGEGPEPYTRIELRMMAASGAVRDKPEWQRKAQDPVITGRWRKELELQVQWNWRRRKLVSHEHFFFFFAGLPQHSD